MKLVLKVSAILVTLIITAIGSLLFLIITVLAAIKNWGSFSNLDYEDINYLDGDYEND